MREIELPETLKKTIEHFSDLPGIGKKSAERLVLKLLKNSHELEKKIGQSLLEVRANTVTCTQCFHYSERTESSSTISNETSLCGICKNLTRNPEQICVVVDPTDLIALERSQSYKGLYHVLHGLVEPLNDVGPEDIRIPQLTERIKAHPEIKEIILALPGSIEGEATGLYIQEYLKSVYTGNITQLARGIPSGGSLDFLDVSTIGRAISERRSY